MSFDAWYFGVEKAINMTGKTDKRGPDALNSIAESARLSHLHERNLLMLEAVTAAMLDVNDPAGVASILREHADDLEDFG